MARNPLPRLAALVVGSLALVGGGVTMMRSRDREVKQPVDLPSVPYATSASYVPCHPGRFETWHRTFHRTMTQRASRASVLGDFADATAVANGVYFARQDAGADRARGTIIVLR